MKDYPTAQIRNVALIGHGGAGKTILGDAILFSTGAVTRIGRVEDGSTVSDYHPDEIERQNSITASLLTTEFSDTKFNIIDTPGFTDFTGEVLSSLRVADAAVLLLKAVESVEVGSEIVWRYTAAAGVPVALLVNKVDNEHADFDRVVEDAQSRFGHQVAVFQFPVKHGPGFNAVVDVLSQKALTFKADGSYAASDVPAEHAGRAAALREALIEKIAESSEDLMTVFFDQG